MYYSGFGSRPGHLLSTSGAVTMGTGGGYYGWWPGFGLGLGLGLGSLGYYPSFYRGTTATATTLVSYAYYGAYEPWYGDYFPELTTGTTAQPGLARTRHGGGGHAGSFHAGVFHSRADSP